MTDTSVSRTPRAGGAEDQSSVPGLFRTWLRAALRGKSDATWRETIEELIEESEEAQESDAALALHERVLLANILRLKDLTAIDVMVPRADIVAVDAATPLPEVQALLFESGHSRVPVYRETLDDVVGMVHLKDVVAALAPMAAAAGRTAPDEGAAAPPAPRQVSDIVRDLLIVAPSMPVLDLLLEMRQNRRHMALVIDEFGGIDGLITVEDLVEEILGKMADEHDLEEEPQVEERPDGSYVVHARYPIDAFEAKVGPVLDAAERDDIDTLGGLVFSMAGRIPARGELLRHPAGLEFEVIDADPRRIKRLRVRRVGLAGESAQPAGPAAPSDGG